MNHQGPPIPKTPVGFDGNGVKSGDSVKIGLLHSLSGTMALSEKSLLDAERMAIDEINRDGGILGCRIDPVVADGASLPERFAQAAQDMVAAGVSSLFGCWTSASRKAVRRVVEASDNLLWYPVQYEGLEESLCICYTGSCLNQQIMPAVEWALEQFGNRIFLLGSDYVFPRAANQLIRSLVKSRGGEIVDEIYVDFGTEDFSEIIARISQTHPSAVINTLNGDSNLAFYRQYCEAGILPSQIPTVATSVTETELESIAAAASGHFACWNYFQSLDIQENHEFVRLFKGRYGQNRLVTAPVVTAYIQLYLWKQAVERAGTFAPSEVRRHLSGCALRSPMGDLRMEENRHLSLPVRIGRLQANGQFEIVWSENDVIAPLPWLGLEKMDFPGKEMVRHSLAAFVDNINYECSLEWEIAERKVLESALQKAQIDLEGKVVERTRQLEKTIEDLNKEITERKRVEEALRASEECYRTLFDRANDGIFLLSDEGNLISVNESLARMHGYSVKEMLVMNLKDLDTPETSQLVSGRMRRLLDGESLTFEVEHYHKDGHIFPLEVSASLIISDGKTFIQCFHRNITERKETNEQIRKLSSAVEQSPVSIMITDLRGAIEYVNPKFTQVTGYTIVELCGQNPRVLKDDNVSPDEYRRLWESITHGREWRGEFHNRKKNGEYFWESASISPIVDADGHATHYLAVKEDITDRKILEEQFRQAQKLESIGQLAGGVAHDFNNILAAMMMRLSFMQNTSADQEALAELTADAKRAASLTRQLLLFSRRSVMEVELLDLNELVANALKMLGRLIGEHITVRFDRNEALPSVEADAVMLEQVLMNLAVNARDAMPKGGMLAIRIEPVQIDEEQVKGNIRSRTGLFVCLSVADTGCGMDEATLKRIFEPFFTTKEVGKGTGLGLATVHGIVTQHKGWVKVESELGKGTTFKVFIPATTQGRTEPTTTEKISVIRGHETILLVEDEATLRRLVAQGLRQMGYHVLEADNGQAAMKLWQEHSQHIDLLFSDMIMPEGMTGLDLAEKMKAEKPILKVIISSGYNMEIAGQVSPTAGGIVYFQKPYDVEALSKIIRDCLDRVSGG